MSPRLNDKTKERILQLSFPEYGQTPLSASQIIKQLEKENEDAEKEIYIIPYSDRTIHAVIKKARQQETEVMEIDRRSWSPALMDKASIPWEAIHFLLEASIEMQKEGCRLFPETDSLIEELHERELVSEWKPPEAGVITVRQAKWLWRIHLALPDVELRNIFWRADMYSHREMMADYLNYPFDTSDLDNGLKCVLMSIANKKTSKERRNKT